MLAQVESLELSSLSSALILAPTTDFHLLFVFGVIFYKDVYLPDVSAVVVIITGPVVWAINTLQKQVLRLNREFI